MNNVFFVTSICLFAGLALGCRSPYYEGAGTLKTERSLVDGVYLDTRHYVSLTNFSMAERFSSELEIKKISNLGSTRNALVQLRFETIEDWTLDRKVLELAPKFGLKLSDMNLISARLLVKVTDPSGRTVLFSDAPLKQYVWSGTRKEGVFIHTVFAGSDSIWNIRDLGPYRVTVEYIPDEILSNRASLEILLSK
jgi:hypothetical protein